MPRDARWANTVRAAAATGIQTQFDAGFLRIYAGTRPAGPSTAISDQTLLAEMTLAATAVASQSDGVLTFAAIGAEDAALATGTPSFARVFAANGTTGLIDLSVGTSDANVILPVATITAGIQVSVSAMSITVPAASAQ